MILTKGWKEGVVPESPRVDPVALERIRIAADFEMSQYTVECDTAFAVEYATHHVRYLVRGYLWGERLGRQEVSYPKDWWQAFKERWFTSWMKRRWPVLMTTRRFVAHALYPDYRNVFPDQRVVFVIRRDDLLVP